MFQRRFENDFQTGSADQERLIDRWNALVPATSGMENPVKHAEEEQQDDDEETTRDVEAEKKKDREKNKQDESQRSQKKPSKGT